MSSAPNFYDVAGFFAALEQIAIDQDDRMLGFHVICRAGNITCVSHGNRFSSMLLFIVALHPRPSTLINRPSLVRPSPVGELRPVGALLMRVVQIIDDGVFHFLL